MQQISSMLKKMCVENAICDIKIYKVILKIFEEKPNIKEISKNKKELYFHHLSTR